MSVDQADENTVISPNPMKDNIHLGLYLFSLFFVSGTHPLLQAPTVLAKLAWVSVIPRRFMRNSLKRCRIKLVK